MNRLFGVRDSRGKLVKQAKSGYWFESKTDAKLFRDTLKEWQPCTVTRGPDHIGPHGNKKRKSRNNSPAPAEIKAVRRVA